MNPVQQGSLVVLCVMLFELAEDSEQRGLFGPRNTVPGATPPTPAPPGVLSLLEPAGFPALWLLDQYSPALPTVTTGVGHLPPLRAPGSRDPAKP